MAQKCNLEAKLKVRMAPWKSSPPAHQSFCHSGGAASSNFMVPSFDPPRTKPPSLMTEPAVTSCTDHEFMASGGPTAEERLCVQQANGGRRHCPFFHCRPTADRARTLASLVFRLRGDDRGGAACTPRRPSPVAADGEFSSSDRPRRERPSHYDLGSPRRFSGFHFVLADNPADRCGTCCALLALG